MKHNSITTIKCRFSNSAHKMLTQNMSVKNSQRWKHQVKKLTDAEKIKLFDELVKMNEETSYEISSALFKRREKKRVEKARVERGYVPKKKTSKEAHEQVN